MILSLAWAGPAEVVLRALAEGHDVSPVIAAQAMRRLTGTVAQTLLQKHKVAHLYPTTRHGGDWAEGQPRGNVDHYTAGNATRGTLLWFSSRPRSPGVGNSSAHIVISPEGEIITVVNPLTTIAWHAGRANNWAIGIEHVNCGLLKTNSAATKFFYQERLAYEINWARPPAKIGNRFWEPFTTPQVLANILFKRLARRAIHTLRKTDFTQHSVVSPRSKVDCGPMWPIQEINDLAFRDVSLMDFAWAKKPYMNMDVLELMRSEVNTESAEPQEKKDA